MQILVVEDNVRLARNIKKALVQNNYCVDIAFDGEEAKAKMVNSYDVVIVDVMMPKIDGYEFVEWLRGQNLRMPVIMLTAKGMLEDKVKGFELGVDDYLTKPFDFKELLLRIQALIRRYSSSDVKLKIDDLELDTNTGRVTRDGKMIELSSTEFRLLQYMMTYPDRIFSEFELLEHVWDRNYDGLSNVVAVYISYLRNKVDKSFKDKPKLIKTVRGMGYKISEDA